MLLCARCHGPARGTVYRPRRFLPAAAVPRCDPCTRRRRSPTVVVSGGMP